MNMKDLIKESFDLWVKMRWLKTIDKEANKYNKLNAKIKRQAYIVHSLIDRYNELYRGEAIGNSKKDS